MSICAHGPGYYIKLDQRLRKFKEEKTMALKDVDVWLGLSKSGKGFSVRVENNYYIGSVVGLQAVLSGEKKGVKLSLQVKDDDADAPSPKDDGSK